MIRHAAVVGLALFALFLSPSWLFAQPTEFAVSAPTANIYKGPSTGSPVIGTAPRGTIFEVTRELGSWVRISWPAADDGIAYVHVSTGSITRDGAPDRRGNGGSTSPRPAPNAPPATTNRRAGSIGNAPPAAPARTTYIAPPTHIVGLGGRIGGSTLGFGGSARTWSRERFGAQLEVSRYALTPSAVPGRATSIQVAPSILYSLSDRVTDFVWIRPYLGSGVGLHRQTFTATPGADSVSDTSLGVQAFGGGEFTFAAVPRFALSADLGYRWSRIPFAGFEFGGLGLSVSGHWYAR